ncbi:Kazal-type serine protease inhibitor domain-containing protein [Spirosoma sp. 209]|uniref:Kazal-type serine protease inhibitor domain-containing protein n=1 Tax=Spirosoma sp. 209 TaxID=1955701 RepID=UPI00098D35EF|nr:Kazal-type serine protease inhibitor domain-containing protein [Spirosoma sp. 209]
MKTFFTVFVLLAGFGCESRTVVVEADCVEKINPDIGCTMQYDPVCGCNGKTYGNACVAMASGIRTVAKGECPGTGN